MHDFASPSLNNASVEESKNDDEARGIEVFLLYSLSWSPLFLACTRAVSTQIFYRQNMATVNNKKTKANTDFVIYISPYRHK